MFIYLEPNEHILRILKAKNKNFRKLHNLKLEYRGPLLGIHVTKEQAPNGLGLDFTITTTSVTFLQNFFYAQFRIEEKCGIYCLFFVQKQINCLYK